MDVEADVLASAEGAADAGERELDLLDRQPQRGRDLVTIAVQALGRDVELDAALGGDRQPGLGAERRLVLHPDLVGALDRDRRRGRQVAVADHQVAHDVAVGVDRFRVGGCVRIRERRQGLVVDDDRRGGPTGGLGVLGRHDRDGFAHEPHDVRRQDRLVAHLEAEGALARDVVGGEHRVHARDGERRADVDRADAGVRVGRAQGVAPEHALGDEVGTERELAPHLGDAVGPQRGLADSWPAPSAGVDGAGGGSRELRVGHEPATRRPARVTCTASSTRP